MKSSPCYVRALLSSSAAVACFLGGSAPLSAKPNTIELTTLSSVRTVPRAVGSKLAPAGAALLVVHDPATQRLFVVNQPGKRVDVIGIDDPSAPAVLGWIDVSAYGAMPTSIAIHEGLLAIGHSAAVKTSPGNVAFFDATASPLPAAAQSLVTVGPLPDFLIFSPDGHYLLSANEGEPNDGYTDDPQGSVSIIDVSGGGSSVTQASVRTAGFTAYNGIEGTLRKAGVRIYGPNATAAQDLEPESIAVSHDSAMAWVTLQENNAIATLDIATATITAISALGTKDHNAPGNAFDASDTDKAVRIRNWPVKGLFLPDEATALQYQGNDYLVLANEGDARDYAGYKEEKTVSSLKLDPTAFSDPTIQQDANLGRLLVTGSMGDPDGDGYYNELFSFGARSFSIWSVSEHRIIWDSGSAFETITSQDPDVHFNASHGKNTFDDRSDNKGPEPEAVRIGKAFGRTYAFVALERVGGIMVYDLTNPASPEFVQYINNRDFTVAVTLDGSGDLGPEGMVFISADDSPTGKPLLALSHEISGTTTLFEIEKVK